MEALQQMKPSMLMNMIYMIKFQELGYCSPGIDVYYFSKTAEKHIEWAYLETIETSRFYWDSSKVLINQRLRGFFYG